MNALFLLAIAAGIGFPPQGQIDAGARGIELVQALRTKLADVQRIECDLVYEYDLGNRKTVPLKAHVWIERGYKYRCELESEDKTYRDVAVQSDGFIWNSSGGVAEEAVVPASLTSSFLFTAEACGPPVEIIYAFFKEDRLLTSLANRSILFIHQQEVEGKRCDVVQVTSTSVRNGEGFSRTTYLWIDVDSGLPVAILTSSFGRGKGGMGPRKLVQNLVLNPTWAKDPFVAPKAEESKGSLDRQRPEPAEVSLVGTALPDFVLQDPSMKEVNLRSRITGPTLITFWASWCGPCDAELAALPNSIAIKALGIKVLSIGVLDSKENLRRHLGKLKETPATFLIDPDCERTRSRLCTHFGVRAIPQCLAVTAEGKIVGHWIGFDNVEELDKKIKNAFKAS